MAWGKPNSDSFQNIFGDTVFTIIGWLSTYYLDKFGNKHDLHSKHKKVI